MSNIWLAASALPLLLAGTPAVFLPQDTALAVPRELMTLLLEKMGGQPFELRAGAPPPSFPQDLLPAETVVAATAISDYGTTVVGTTTLSSLDPLKERARLGTSGWLDSAPLLGFVANEPDASVRVCRGSQFAVIDYRQRSAGGTAVRAVVAPAGSQPCVAWRGVAAGAPLPVLVAPDGAMISQGRGGAGADGGSFNVRLSTSLSLADLTAHYVKQLEAQGWKSAGLPSIRQTSRPPSTTTTAETETLLTPPIASGERVGAMLRVMQVSYSSTFDVVLSIYRCTDGRGFGMPCGPRMP